MIIQYVAKLSVALMLLTAAQASGQLPCPPFCDQEQDPLPPDVPIDDLREIKYYIYFGLALLGIIYIFERINWLYHKIKQRKEARRK